MIAGFSLGCERSIRELTYLFILFIVLNLCLSSPSSFAEEFNLKDNDSGQPITINANRLEADSDKRLITFTGNVVSRQEGMIIHSDILFLTYRKEGGEIEKAVARGNVKIVQENENRVATAGEAVFYNQEKKVVLTKNPKVRQGKDMISGEIITLFIEEERSIVEGGNDKRVNATIYPKEE